MGSVGVWSGAIQLAGKISFFARCLKCVRELNYQYGMVVLQNSRCFLDRKTFKMPWLVLLLRVKRLQGAPEGSTGQFR